MSADIHERAPQVTIEVQPRPPVPEHCVPYWWGNSVLTFRQPNGQVVWEGEFPHPDGHCRVEKRTGFGWVIVLTLTHERAERALEPLCLPRAVEGSAESRWSHWPVDEDFDLPTRASDWGAPIDAAPTDESEGASTGTQWPEGDG